MKIFSSSQIKQLDLYTIEHEPVSSIKLMERASSKIADWLLHFLDRQSTVLVFAGFGNNGGDGLAVARMLNVCGVNVEVYLVRFGKTLSADCSENKAQLLQKNIIVTEINSEKDFPQINENDIVVDALFGSGLNRPIKGDFGTLIKYINQSKASVISVDIPSGLYSEGNAENDGEIVHANHTLSLQFPKYAMLFPENQKYVGQFHILDISLHQEGMNLLPTPYFFTTQDDLPIILKRNIFSHKGTYGHALFIGGSYGKMGAVVLATKACLRTGVGLVTAVVPAEGLEILQCAVPEVMCLVQNEKSFGEIEKYSAVGVGCGLGKEHVAVAYLHRLLEIEKNPIVLDADALNILSEHQDWIQNIPQGSVLTPHPKEWERLCGVSAKNREKQVSVAQDFCKKFGLIVVLKGAYTAVIDAEGNVRFNSTGNAGMATAGSGDVLCGVILSLLAQGYSSKNAAILGTYLHGLAGDIAVVETTEYTMIASDIIKKIPAVYKKLNCR